MKNKIIVVFLFALGFISFSLNARAYDPYYPGSTLNPLQIEIIPKTGDRLDALIEQQAQERIFQQQQQYQQQLLDIQRQQLKLQQNQQYNRKFQAEGEAIRQMCKEYYGIYSVWRGVMTGRTPVCDCLYGYQWNQEQTQCVVIATKINNQGLSGGGGGSNTTSTLMCNGKEWLTCPAGQKFYCPPISGDARCTVLPQKEIRTSVIKKLPEVKSTQKMTKENTIDTTKLDAVNVEQKVTPRTEEVKLKTGWGRIKGWFGF